MFKTPHAGRKRPATLAAAVAGGQAPWVETLWPGGAALFGVDAGRRQLWFAVGAQLALRPERAEAAPRGTAALARWLETARAGDIVRETGLGAPPGWRRALARLGPLALADPAGYLRLFDVLAAGGPGADILRHAEPLTEGLLAVLDALPPELRQPALVASLVRSDAEEVGTEAAKFAWRLGRLRALAPVVAEAVEAAIRDGASRQDLLDEDGPGRAFPFPPPPWPGTDRLRPLCSAEAMVEAGRRMGNCLGGRTSCVHDGRSFYYLLEGDPVVAVELERDGPFGWTVDDARGPKNRSCTPEELARLAAELAGAEGVFCHTGHLAGRGGRLIRVLDADGDEDDE